MEPDRSDQAPGTTDQAPEAVDDASEAAGRPTAEPDDASEAAGRPTAEPDPEADFYDPDSDSLTIPRVETEDAGSGLRSDLQSDLETPAVDVPEVDVPEVSDDVPAGLLETFWSLVLVVNAAVLAVALGVLFLVFEGPGRRSVLLLVAGVVLFGFATHRYRAYRRATEDGD